MATTDNAGHRPSLRQFQDSLAARMREAAGQKSSSSQLGLQSGGRHWLLNLEDAGEIVPVAGLTPVPFTKPWLPGLVNVRGNLVSVVDLSLFTGGAPTPRTAEARIVLVAEKYHVRAGLLVERMLGLQALQRMTAVEDAAKTAPVVGWAPQAWQDGDGRQWSLLDMAALATNTTFLQAGL
jgi:twitching motility protein PilI